MSGSVYQAYDPSNHAEEYGWIWTEGSDGECGWHMVFTIEDEDELRLYFVASDQTEDAEAYAGQPYMGVGEPPTPGSAAPGYILTIADHKGARVTFSWGPDGAGSDGFLENIRNAVEQALSGDARP